MHLVIVESPAKAKTINNYLGKDYKVLASFGHVRDLPSKKGSVNPEENFSMLWEIETSSKKHLSTIVEALKKADSLILATDPDREGEAISWHVLEFLKEKKVLKNKKISRVVFNAITKQSILQAIENPREINQSLVDAYLARRALDYLVGFTLSPLLWKKLPGARSAGRVQSVALRLICERESEIENFISQEYWSVQTSLQTKKQEHFEAKLTAFHAVTIQKMDIETEEKAKKIELFLEKAEFTIASIEKKPVKRNPFAPFTTSTLQQAASSQLGFSPSRTMQIAQRLYEGIHLGKEEKGLITYMRTDSTNITPEAIEALRKVIGKNFGSAYLPEKPVFYKTKTKNAQEAHEAIRPTDFSYNPKTIQQYLTDEQFKLYELIWKRTIASQMRSAELERTIVQIQALGENKKETADLRAVGSVVRFDGFMAVFDPIEDQTDEETQKIIPTLEINEMVHLDKIHVSHHVTEHPPRYSEAGLIKKMEELGIGRPSTYASILKTLNDREYVTLEKRKLHPNSLGRIVTTFLYSFFQKYVEYDFTAGLEKNLDEISNGNLLWKHVLSEFWNNFSASVDQMKELRITDVINTLNKELALLFFSFSENKENPRSCPKCGDGILSLKLSKYGAFIGCESYPTCNYTHQFKKHEETNQNSFIPSEGLKITSHDSTEEEFFLRLGRFGYYLEKGEGKEKKRTSVPKTWDPETIDYSKAKSLLSLPRTIGTHPESGAIITAGLGRYGPFILHNGVYVNLKEIEDLFSIDVDEAVSLLEAKKSSNKKQSSVIKNLGSPNKGEKNIILKEGRYGPYINYGKINVKLDKNIELNTFTIEDALKLLKKSSSKK